jgi:hypothetical protein
MAPVLGDEMVVVKFPSAWRQQAAGTSVEVPANPLIVLVGRHGLEPWTR